MAYKFKPNKSVAKRFRVTKTGKLKRHHSFTSHLMSSRPSSKRRKLRRPAILFEGHARNMRQLLGISGTRPEKIRHERELAAQAQASGKASSPEAKSSEKKSSDKKSGERK
jgi:large subunit ribosomal protein L35